MWCIFTSIIYDVIITHGVMVRISCFNSVCILDAEVCTNRNINYWDHRPCWDLDRGLVYILYIYMHELKVVHKTSSWYIYRLPIVRSNTLLETIIYQRICVTVHSMCTLYTKLLGLGPELIENGPFMSSRKWLGLMKVWLGLKWRGPMKYSAVQWCIDSHEVLH